VANTYDLKEVWDEEYELSLYKQPTFRVIAETKFEPKLKMGLKFHRTSSGDFVVNNMGSNGSYSIQGWSDTDEYVTVNTKKEASFQLVDWQEVQAHLPTARKYGQKAANAVGLQLDADILNYTYQQAPAGNVLDDGVVNANNGGVTGNGVTVSTGNIAQIFTLATQQFQLANVSYDPNARFTKDVKLDKIGGMMSAIISPQMYSAIVQYVGGKNTVLGDTVTRNGHAGEFMGYNLFVSNNLGWESTLTLTTNPTAGDTMTIGSVTFTFVSSIGSTPGNILIGATLSNTVTNIIAALSAPYTTTSTFVAITQGALTANAWVGVQKLFNNVTATNPSGTLVKIAFAGATVVVVSSTFTATTNVFTAALQKTHCLFTVGKTTSLIVQKTPGLFINPVSGQVAKDFVTWTLYGYKSYADQTPGIIDLQVNSSAFTAPLNYAN
jgi:hypothetical protein